MPGNACGLLWSGLFQAATSAFLPLFFDELRGA
jgi:hypothetical protein